MAEVNRMCVRILVHEEDMEENPVSAQRRRDNLQTSAQAPVTCLVGTMGTLSEALSRLTLLQRPSCTIQISRDSGGVHPESTADDDKAEKPPSLPSPTLQKSNVATEKKVEGIPKLVELYQCPLFPDTPVPLPHDTPYATIVTRVVQAQRHLVHKPSLKASFQTILSTPAMEDFVIDSFWWLFLHNFRPDRATQDRLFSRIAENYIRILTQNLSARSGTAFLQMFSSTLSQTLYCCFCCCFPQSSNFRNQAFLTSLCSTAYQWTGGICPAPDVYKTWDFEALEPDEASGVPESEKRQKESGSSLNLLDAVFSGTSFPKPSIQSQRGRLTAEGPKRSKWDREVKQINVVCSKNNMATASQVEKAGSENSTASDLKALTDHGTSVRESHAVDECVELKHCVFNVWGHSPLVQHYMTTHNLKQTVGHDLLVKRTQIHKVPPGNSLTHRDVLRQALERSSSHWEALSSLLAHHAHELTNLQQRHHDEQVQLLRRHKKILSQKNVIRQLCQLLVPPAKGEEDNKTRSKQQLAFERTLDITE